MSSVRRHFPGIALNEVCYLTQYTLYAVMLAAGGHAFGAAFLEIGAVLLGALAVLVTAGEKPGLPFRRLRWFYFLAAMPVCYHALGAGVLQIRADHAPALQQADRFLIGGNAGLLLEPWSHPVLTEILSWSYMAFFPFIALGLWRHGWKAGERAGPFFRTLGLLYGVGFTGYLICPAAGPYHDMPGAFAGPLEGWAGTRLNEAMVRWGGNRVDCFPSLHCAVSGALLVFDARLSRRLALLHFPLVAAIWFSTVYLRQHYFVDVIAGFFLMAAALWISLPRRSKH